MKIIGKCSLCEKHAVIWERKDGIQKCKRCVLRRDNNEV